MWYSSDFILHSAGFDGKYGTPRKVVEELLNQCTKCQRDGDKPVRDLLRCYLCVSKVEVKVGHDIEVPGWRRFCGRRSIARRSLNDEENSDDV